MSRRLLEPRFPEFHSLGLRLELKIGADGNVVKYDSSKGALVVSRLEIADVKFSVISSIGLDFVTESRSFSCEKTET